MTTNTRTTLAVTGALAMAVAAYTMGRLTTYGGKESMAASTLSPRANDARALVQQDAVRIPVSTRLRIENGLAIAYPVWRGERSSPTGEVSPPSWGLAIRGADEPAYSSSYNPFAEYEFTTMEQAIADGYYVPFEIWVPERTLNLDVTDTDGQPLDVDLVVPGHWSWAIRRYDELAYEYPPDDHVYDPWQKQ